MGTISVTGVGKQVIIADKFKLDIRVGLALSGKEIENLVDIYNSFIGDIKNVLNKSDALDYKITTREMQTVTDVNQIKRMGIFNTTDIGCAINGGIVIELDIDREAIAGIIGLIHEYSNRANKKTWINIRGTGGYFFSKELMNNVHKEITPLAYKDAVEKANSIIEMGRNLGENYIGRLSNRWVLIELITEDSGGTRPTYRSASMDCISTEIGATYQEETNRGIDIDIGEPTEREVTTKVTAIFKEI